jgi:hypothetical protein
MDTLAMVTFLDSVDQSTTVREVRTLFDNSALVQRKNFGAREPEP